MAGRNTERDGVANQLEFHVLTHYEPVWRVLRGRACAATSTGC